MCFRIGACLSSAPLAMRFMPVRSQRSRWLFKISSILWVVRKRKVSNICRCCLSVCSLCAVWARFWATIISRVFQATSSTNCVARYSTITPACRCNISIAITVATWFPGLPITSARSQGLRPVRCALLSGKDLLQSVYWLIWCIWTGSCRWCFWLSRP